MEQGVTAEGVSPYPTPDGGGSRPRMRWGRAVLWSALAVMVAATVTVIALNDPERSPEEDLKRVRDFVTEHSSARFQGEWRSEMGPGHDQPGSSSTDLSRLEGTFRTPGSLHYIDDSGDSVDEYIQVPGASYSRSADTRAELEAEPWVYEEEPAGPGGSEAGLPPSLDESGAAAVHAASGVFSTFEFPYDVSELLAQLRKVERVSPGVLQAQVTVRELLPQEVVQEIERHAAEAEAKAKEMEAAAEAGGTEGAIEMYGGFMTDYLDDPVTVRLTHADDGRLDELVVVTESGEADDEERSVDTTTLRFSGWGQPVDIQAPPAGSVDPTPEIDEEDLAAFTAFPILAPATPPAGMVLRSASVDDFGLEEDEEFASCKSVDLSYGPPGPYDPDAEGPRRSLNLSLTQGSCPWGSHSPMVEGREVAPETAQIGPYQGEVRTFKIPGDPRGEERVNVQLTAGATEVDADTSLPKDEAIAVLSTLAPLDLSKQPIERQVPPGG